MTCPINGCTTTVTRSLRVCKRHWSNIPVPQQQALASFARVNNGGPAHKAAFARAIESIHKTLEFHNSLAQVPARPKYWDE